MERILTAKQMRQADKFTIENLGVSENVLIERAGAALAEEIIKRFHGGRVLVCVGKGKNGADGKIAAEILSKVHGFSVVTINVSNGVFKAFERKFDIIVDCIMGTGLNRPVEGYYKTAVEKINDSGAYIVSCDIPTGINGDNGKVMGVAVKANLTVAIQEYKLGHFLNDGIDYSGIVVAKDIGISIWGDEFVMKMNSSSVANYFKPLNRNVNKGMFGKCAVIGGSSKYTGSLILSASALASFKMGVGYVNMVVPKSLFNAYVGKVPECLLTAINDNDGEIVFDKETLDSLLSYEAIGIGMGIGVSEEVYKTIEYLLKNYKGTLLIDADALNTLAKYGDEILLEKTCNVILTPHVGEFSRLSKISKEEILENPIDFAINYARHNDVVLALKSAVSIITDGNDCFINVTGTAGMAKAGSGDVLSGFILGLVARNDDLLTTTTAGCYLFGRAGEIAEETESKFTMTASDVLRALPRAISRL